MLYYIIWYDIILYYNMCIYIYTYISAHKWNTNSKQTLAGHLHLSTEHVDRSLVRGYNGMCPVAVRTQFQGAGNQSSHHIAYLSSVT